MRRWFAKLAAAAVMMAGATVSSVAAPLSGVFTIDVYQGNGGGVITAPEVQALAANPLITGTPYATVTYTGDIDFFLGSGGTNTVEAFLDSGTGTYTSVGGLLNVLLSAGGFGLTTVLDIYGTTGTAIKGTITHDDGVGLYQSSVLVTPLASSEPTTPIGTDYTLAAGSFRLIYVAANNLPEQLGITAEPTTVVGVPEPLSMALFGAGLLGLAVARRRTRG
jgi:hypothetical protein